MIIAILLVAGLCAGSFINALVWRMHEQSVESAKKKPNKRYLTRVSILKGRSMCPDCGHNLAVKDLIPVISWLSLRGKCRYCKKPISVQYPLVEITTVLLFIASYIWWPVDLHGVQITIFIIWLLLLIGLIALSVYDLRWMLLPDRLINILASIALLQVLIAAAEATRPLIALLNALLAVLVGGGVFYVIFQISEGKWIGGGDVKLGFLLGLIVATPARSLLFIFLAAIGGSLLTLPLLYMGKLKRTSIVPFGPFLILGAIIVVLFGASILHWYQQSFITF
jgi:prepilin signal peptidase PulO-like enzyme (type II secretory pathway)